MVFISSPPCSVLCDDTDGATSDLLCSAALRSASGRAYQGGGEGGALGVVVVSRKRTSRDCGATLKINCQPDTLVRRLIDRYGILADVPKEVVENRIKYEAVLTERSSVLSSLEDAVMYEEDDPRVYHGRLFSSICLLEPQLSEAGSLTDTDNVSSYKLRHIQDLIKLSGRTLVFTEAVTNRTEGGHGHYGAKQCCISHSHHGEDQAVPAGHRVISSLARVGLVQAWVQLGHDGLPQEAGCPLQVREIYDSWRSEDHQCYKDELSAVDTEIKQADLILIFGHNLSLAGKTAQTLSEISRRNYQDLGQSLGLVIISDTTTALDKFATVRVNQSADLALESLQDMMDIPSLPTITITEPALDVAEVGSAPDPAQSEEAFPPPEPTSAEEAPTADVGRGGDGADGDGDVGGGGGEVDGDGGEVGGGVRGSEGSEPPCADSSHRAYIADALTHFKQIQPGDPRIYHGRLLSETCLEEPEQSQDREHTRTYKLEKLIDLVKVCPPHLIRVLSPLILSFSS